jgi:TPR repeat protein
VWEAAKLFTVAAERGTIDTDLLFMIYLCWFIYLFIYLFNLFMYFYICLFIIACAAVWVSGNSIAQVHLGMMYRDGVGVKANLALAKQWYVLRELCFYCLFQ